MSIVEAAIKRLHDAKPAAESGDRRDEDVLANAALRMPVESRSGEYESAKTAFTPADSVRLDLEALTAEGMFPAPDYARRSAEEFRRAKWPILRAAFGSDGERVPNGELLLVTSALPDEGKSYVSLNLALSIALERDRQVLIIDADVAKAKISRLAHVGDRAGLTDLLGNDSLAANELIVGTSVPGIHILPVGRHELASPELFASDRMGRLLDGILRDHPSWFVILDCAPLLATNEAQVLARVSGQVLVVVKANDTPQSAVTESLGLLDRNRPIHLLLNQIKHGWFADGYSRYYDAYQREPR